MVKIFVCTKNLIISFIIPTVRNDILTLESIRAVRDKYNVEVVVIVDRKGRNPAWARNEGVQRSHGDIYVFCDDDIVFSDELIDYVINTINRNSRSILGIVNNDKLFGTYVMTRFIALHREFFKKIGRFDEEIGYMGEDVELSIRARMLGAKIVPIDSNKIIHVDHSVNRLKNILNQVHLTHIIIKHGKYFRLRALTFFVKSNMLRVLLRVFSFYYIIFKKILKKFLFLFSNRH